jgi:uncharacterized protein with ParB-like and HNH nuclease domain
MTSRKSSPVIERLEARLDGVGHVLSDKRIVVPPYQRPYSWTDEQIEELLRDVSDAMRRNDADYFLGTVVLTKDASGQNAVIDGQQRLATVSILIAAIRDYFISKNDIKRSEEIERTYLARTELRELTQTAQLKLIESDNGFYENLILKREKARPKGRQIGVTPSPSHLRISRALELCTGHVVALVRQTNDPTQLLLDWIDYLAGRVKVIVVEVNDEAAAYTIFEVLNDRGLDLSVSDLLKNLVFRVAGDKVQEAQEQWTRAIGILESVGVEDREIRTFIRHAWASEYGLTREKELYSSIRNKITSKSEAIEYAARLSEHARIYAALQNPHDDYWRDFGAAARSSIEALNVLKVTQVRPLLLAVLRYFEPKEVSKALPMLVSWSVRFLIVGRVGSGPLENGYSDRAKEVSAEKIRTAASLHRSSEDFLVKDTEFEAAFRSARVSGSGLARYYLRVLEQVASGQKEMIVNPNEDDVNLEHVMPQTREPHWRHIPFDDHKAHVKRLGNLVLLDRKLNAAAGNLPFEKKKPIFAKSEINITSGIGSYSDWGIEEIELRQKELAKLAVKAWPIRPR